MGRTRPLFVAVFTCIFLTSQNVLTKSTDTIAETQHDDSHNKSTSSADDETNRANAAEEVMISAQIDNNTVVFRWNQPNQQYVSYQARFKTEILACDRETQFNVWNDIEESFKKINAKPNNNVTFQLRNKKSNKVTTKSRITPSEVPDTRVTQFQCDKSLCTADVENDCNKHNGDNLKVQFVLKPLKETLQKNPIVINSTVTSENKATIEGKTLDLLPFTNYSVSANPVNDKGISNFNKTCFFLTKVAKPGKVRNLRVVRSSCYSLQVEWIAPNDNPPKGILEKYELTWIVKSVTTGEKNAKVNESVTSFVIRELNPETTYMITVAAKNKGERKFGDISSIMANTTVVKNPEPVVNLTSTPETTTTTLYLSWNPSGIDEINVYRVFLHKNNTKIGKTNTTDTWIKFDNLTAGTMYTVKVKACIKRNCSKVEESVWTRPDKPNVQETTGYLDATDTTITIKLPTLENPPGFHWILMKREGGTSDGEKTQTDNIKKKAMDIVRKERETRSKRVRRSINTDQNDEEMFRIATEIKLVKGDKDPKKNVTLGDGSSEGNSQLQSETRYMVMIVTETRSGDYSEYCSYEPQIFKTKRKGEITVIAVIGSICAAAVILVGIVTLLATRCKNQRKKLVVGENPNPIKASSAVNMMVHIDDEIPLAGVMSGEILTVTEQEENKKNTVEEDLYANVREEISKKDLEMYLPKAIYASETTLEFNSVPFFMPGKTASGSRISENVPKNRYRNEISYDDTRVKLPLFNDIPYSDYINANFVLDPLGQATFIATQGPKDHNVDTIGAFWRMIWHTKCSMILMVANLVESGKVKVAQYWPEKEPLVKEGVKVTLTSVRVVMDFAVRTFIVAVDGMEREVTQYQYTAWPDHGVPQTAYGLSQMLNTVIKHDAQGQGGPITVHCSAGIGRTGTVLLTMFLLRQLKAFNAVNIRKALHTLRAGRGRLVENTEQYIFVHKLLHDMLFGMKTTFSCDSFLKEVAARRCSKAPDSTLILQKEFEKIKNLPKDLTFKHGSDPACAHLNRNQAILPADKRMVFVQGHGREIDSQYLNVIRINGFDRKDAYLAGEHPQAHTLAKMWSLVFDRKIPVWLLVQELPQKDPSFPDVVYESSSLPRNMTLKTSRSTQFENFTEYNVVITMNKMKGSESHKCIVLMLKGWLHTARLPTSPNPLLGAIEKAESLLSPQNPLLFTCSNGVTGCGVMAALLLAVSRAKLTQEVDLYRSVVNVQYDRPQFITDLAQYQFLHTAMEAFLNVNKHYGNFV